MGKKQKVMQKLHGLMEQELERRYLSDLSRLASVHPDTTPMTARKRKDTEEVVTEVNPRPWTMKNARLAMKRGRKLEKSAKKRREQKKKNKNDSKKRKTNARKRKKKIELLARLCAGRKGNRKERIAKNTNASEGIGAMNELDGRQEEDETLEPTVANLKSQQALPTKRAQKANPLLKRVDPSERRRSADITIIVIIVTESIVVEVEEASTKTERKKRRRKSQRRARTRTKTDLETLTTSLSRLVSWDVLLRVSSSTKLSNSDTKMMVPSNASSKRM